MSPTHAGNAEVAAAFEQIADLLDVASENPFRVRAYRNAARMLAGLGRGVDAMVSRGEDLDALPGIGPDLAARITEIVTTGRCALLEQLRARQPPAVGELLRLPGLGPKRVNLLCAELGIRTVAELHRAAAQGRIEQVQGFGPVLQRRILQATSSRRTAPRRWLHAVADPLAEELLALLRAVPGVTEALAAGSLRRGRDTVGDLDLLVAAAPGSAVMARFLAQPRIAERLQRGPTRASVLLEGGMQVDLRVVPPECFGAAAVYFTGAKAHNIALRRLAQARGLKINEYGVFRGAARIAGDSEASVYAAVGLPWIPPELREDRGELEAARGGRLPRLLRREDLRGDLHAHSRDSDGSDDLETLAAAAGRRGLSYLAVTDHARRPGLARGLDAAGLAAQIDRIDRANAEGAAPRLLKGVEVEILEDGSLGLPDALLSRLDLVVGAVHDHLDLPRARQTSRLLRALDHRHFSILAHPAGRLIGERPPLAFDLGRVLRRARERGCFVELNAQPSRLDLDDLACRMAKDEGVLVSIASDAHEAADFEHLAGGVQQARRGWLEAGDVLNTRGLDELLALLKPTMR